MTGSNDQAEADRERIERAKQEARESTITERFWAFHFAHPNVYTTLVGLAREWQAKRSDRCSIAWLWGHMRWERRMAGLPDGSEAFKLNDHYKADYARMMMENEPGMDGLFEIRRKRRRER